MLSADSELTSKVKMENFEKTAYTIGKLRKKYVGNA